MSAESQKTVIQRTLLSLEGIAHGDAFGESLRDFFSSAAEFSSAITSRSLPPDPWFWTDDTAMATGVVEALLRHGVAGHENELAEIFGRNSVALGVRSYTMAMCEMLAKFRQLGNWQELSSSAFGGTGSFGNGSAMRSASIGAFFADSPVERIVAEAAASSRVTHWHQEAIAGAAAVALAAAFVARSPETTDQAGLLAFVVTGLADSPFASLCAKVRDVPLGMDLASAARAAEVLGNGSKTACSDTVPFALWCACSFLEARLHGGPSFQDVMWLTASVMGDIDTNCAIVGGIVANAFRGKLDSMAEWVPHREPLIISSWDPLPDDSWPLGPPHKGRGLHPMPPVTTFL